MTQLENNSKDVLRDVDLKDSVGTYTVDVTEDIDLNATFEIAEYHVSIVKTGTGNGTVTVSAYGITLFKDGYLPAGSQVSIVAAPDNDSDFNCMSIGNTPAANEAYTTISKLDSDLKITVVFDATSKIVTYNTPANGTLRVCDSQGNYIKSGQSVEVGTILIISAIPDDHYVLDSLKAGGSSISGNTYSVDASKTNLIEAHFKLAEVKVTLSDTDNGTIKAYTYDGTEIPSGSYIAVGEKIRVVATPKNENFQLDTLKMNGNNIKNGSQNTVPAEDVTLSATFKYVGDMPSIGDDTGGGSGDDTGGGGGGDTGGGSGDDTGGGGGGGGSTAIQETETATFESISVLTTDGSLTALGTITESDDETVVTVSGESFAKLADHAETNSTGIVFNAGLGSVTFNSKALSYIDGIADSGDVVLTVSKVSPDVLSEENRRLVGNHPVYDFSLTAGDVKVNTFGGGEVNISIPYTLKPGETAETLVVYYIDDAGILKTIRGAYHADTGTVDFTVTHFSYYTMGNNPVDFRDVPAESWYYKPVSFVAARGITLGLKEGIFGQSFVEAGIVSGSDGFLYPASMSTRAQMAQVLYKLLSK